EREELFMLQIPDTIFIAYRQKFPGKIYGCRPPVPLHFHEDRFFNGPILQSFTASGQAEALAGCEQWRFYFKNMRELFRGFSAGFFIVRRKQDFLKCCGIK